MAVELPPPPPEDPNISKPNKRIRWATQRVSSVSARRKKNGIMNRFHKNGTANEKKRDSGGSESVEGSNTGVQEGEQEEEDGTSNRRRVFFNIPLPDDAKDEDGNPSAHFGRNKIRTAKYTPLSFVPKNLWYQFHNIANVYFLFLIILAVSYTCKSNLNYADKASFSLYSEPAILALI